MEEKKNILTHAGLRRLEDELTNLKTVRRGDVAQKLKEARAQGDLSENAEYDAAKDEQRDIEARIEELESILKNVEVISEDEAEQGRVGIGSCVTVRDMEENEIIEYFIVGSKESNVLENRISNESPVGMALLGAAIGDTVKVETMAGTLTFMVLDVRRDRDAVFAEA